MEYVYSAMLLHKAGKQINEDNVKKVLEAAGVNVNEARVKALVAALDGINIEEAIEKASSIQAAAAPVIAVEAKVDEKKNAEETKKTEETAAAGLGALFG